LPLAAPRNGYHRFKYLYAWFSCHDALDDVWDISKRISNRAGPDNISVQAFRRQWLACCFQNLIFGSSLVWHHPHRLTLVAGPRWILLMQLVAGTNMTLSSRWTHVVEAQ
jgi:hypothetical protein